MGLYLVSFLAMVAIYGLLTLALNVQWGSTGLFNIGIAAFFAVGAYTTAILTTPPPAGVLLATGGVGVGGGAAGMGVGHWGGLGWPPVAGIVAGSVAAALLAIPVGLLTLRLRGDYLAIATIGLAETLRLFLKNQTDWTGGANGIGDIPQFFRGLTASGQTILFTLVAAAICAVAFILVQAATRSPWGRVLRAIRDDEAVVSATGKNVFRFRLQALVFGASIMGLAGALYAHYTGFISPDAFEPMNATFLVWVMLIAGGSGNNWGALLGALVVWGIWSGSDLLTGYIPAAWATRAAALRVVIIGVLLEAILVWRPRGLLGEDRHVSMWVKPGPASAQASTPRTSAPSTLER
ncbi:MAG: branched-chain amino acid ABC transporter permease [Limnochordaceae bacterium]|nr:branched-chain amino acid ABC transporter permease [Limnochordaceae bacterium]